MSFLVHTADLHPAGGPAASPFDIVRWEEATDFPALRRTATERTTSSTQRREKRKHQSQRSLSGSKTTMISPEEYESLPPSIQQKYFSSAERLHIAQQSAADKRRKQSLRQGAWLASPTSVKFPARPSTSSGISSRKRQFQNLVGDPTTIVAGFGSTISEEQARWYVTLPDKIRRQHFSREEQVSLALRCKSVLEQSSPELASDALRRCLSVGHKSDFPNKSGQRSRRLSAGTVDTDLLSLSTSSRKGVINIVNDTASVRSLDTADAEMEIFKLYTQRRKSLSSLNDAKTIPPPPPVPPIPPMPKESRRKSITRMFNLTPLPLPPPTLAPVSSAPAQPADNGIRHFALSARLSRHNIDQISLDDEPVPEVKYYQDTDARQQLRNYISPEKFDEALEFGFASTSSEEHIPSTSSTNQSFPLQQPISSRFSEYDTDDGDNDSLPTLSPRTPTPYSDLDHTAVKQGSFDSGIQFQYEQHLHQPLIKTPTTASPAGSIGNREMTIHMTLTRRDLRSPEDELYSAQRQQTSGVDIEKVDPLALEALPVCDDPTGASGAFAVQDEEAPTPKGLKRVWKKVLRH